MQAVEPEAATQLRSSEAKNGTRGTHEDIVEVLWGGEGRGMSSGGCWGGGRRRLGADVPTERARHQNVAIYHRRNEMLPFFDFAPAPSV